MKLNIYCFYPFLLNANLPHESPSFVHKHHELALLLLRELYRDIGMEWYRGYQIRIASNTSMIGYGSDIRVLHIFTRLQMGGRLMI